MSFILYLAGIIIAFAIFFYVLNLYESGKNKLKNKNKPEKSLRDDITPVPKKIYRAPGERTCPLCGAALTKYEALYATRFGDKSGKKILIYGCRYCYKDDENPEKIKKSDY